jgi:hypothetical protein
MAAIEIEEGRALARPEPAEALLPDRATAERQLQAVREFQATVKALFVRDHDYGAIPGTGTKPTLLKPGAEKLAKLLGLADHYEILDRIEDWDRPLFRYVVRCSLTHMASGRLVSQGLGECNSYEARYRWRWVWPADVSDEERRHLEATPGRTRQVRTRNGAVRQYRVENDDVYSQVNTILKMAKKRALVDAALSAGRLSDVFTQDLEDLAAESEHSEGAASVEPATVAVAREGGTSPAAESLERLWQRWQDLSAAATALGVQHKQPPRTLAPEKLLAWCARLQELVDQAERERDPEAF